MKLQSSCRRQDIIRGWGTDLAQLRSPAERKSALRRRRTNFGRRPTRAHLAASQPISVRAIPVANWETSRISPKRTRPHHHQTQLDLAEVAKPLLPENNALRPLPPPSSHAEPILPASNDLSVGDCSACAACRSSGGPSRVRFSCLRSHGALLRHHRCEWHQAGHQGCCWVHVEAGHCRQGRDEVPAASGVDLGPRAVCVQGWW